MIRLKLWYSSACLYKKTVFTLLLIAAAGFSLYVTYEMSWMNHVLSRKDVRTYASRRDSRSEIAAVTGSSVIGSSKTVVLTTTNSGYIDLAENWLASIEKCGVRPNVTIIAEDNGAYEKLTLRKYSFEVHVLRAKELSPTRKMVGYTEAFNHFVNKRASYILALLEAGYNVFFTDVDTFWMGNPFPYFHGDYDAWFGLDWITAPKSQLQRPCAGLTYWRRTNASMDFLQTWIQTQETRTDTIILDLWMLEPGVVNALKWKGLDPEKFVNGQAYFHDAWRLKNPEVKPVILHNNWCYGHDYKVARFQHIGLWLIDYSNVDEDKTLLKLWPPFCLDREEFGSQHPGFKRKRKFTDFSDG